MNLTVDFAPVLARHIRVRARTFGPLPAWHPGAGSPAFIFCDEIAVTTVTP
jgi:hypothetical protein